MCLARGQTFLTCVMISQTSFLHTDCGIVWLSWNVSVKFQCYLVPPLYATLCCTHILLLTFCKPLRPERCAIVVVGKTRLQSENV